MKLFLNRAWRFHREGGPKPFARVGILAAMCALTGLELAGSAQLVDTQSIRKTLSALTQESFQFFGAALFFALLVFALSALLRSLFLGGTVLSAIAVTISFVNHFKTLITSTPLEVQDFALAGKAGNIAGLNAQYITLSRNSLMAIVVTVLWLAVLYYFSRPLRLSFKTSLAAFAAATGVFLLLFALSADSLFYTPMAVPLNKGYSQSYVNSRTGFVLGLWRSVIYKDIVTADYSQEETEQVYSELKSYISGLGKGGDGEKVNVILILSESFFDVTALPGVSYASDPIPEYHALQNEGVSGNFYTRTLGYGTCNIELELLTGINTRLMPYGEALNTWPAERFEKLPTIPSILQKNGYYTAFLHMYNDSIYNRRAFLPGLGFDDVFFSEDMAKIDPVAAAAGDNYWDYMESKISGWFYSDDYMADLLIDLFKEKSGSSPVFIYGVSMENHSTYEPDKYDVYDHPFTSALDEEATGALNAATQGISNASRALGKLTDYLRTTDEPTVVIFFGDHRPGLGLEEGGTVYSALGMCDPDSSQWSAETFKALYRSDYLIWANDPALLPDASGTKVDNSSNYLGLEILDAAHVEKPDYWRMLESMHQTSLAYTWNYYITNDGQISLDMPEMSDYDRQKFDVMSFILHDAYAMRYITDKLF
ncbi:MAG: LTA synthase family protein [Oscillospiraceae bacterium]